MIGGDHPVMAGVLAELNPAEKVVLVVLCAHADRRGECWPSIGRLRAVTGYSRATVCRALQELRHRGLVMSVGRGPAARSQYASIRVRVRFPEVSPVRPLDGPEVSSARRPEVSFPDVQGSHQRDPEVPMKNQKKENPARKRAEAILRAWWEHQTPRPQQPWPAAVQVLTKALDGGLTEAHLAAFLEDEGAPISGGRIDMWLRRRGNGRVTGNVDEAAIHDYVQTADKLRAKIQRTKR